MLPQAGKPGSGRDQNGCMVGIMTHKVTVPMLLQMKRDGRKSVGVVAWDYQIARIADRAGVDIV